MKHYKIKNCSYCKKEFEGKTKYCSLYCKNEASIQYATLYRKKHLEKLHKYKKICIVCEKEFFTNSDKRICCSKECVKINNKKHYFDNLPLKICPACSKEFKSSKKYCNEECRKSYQKINNKNKKTEHTKNCKQCGVEFITTNSRKVFCSGCISKRTNKTRICKQCGKEYTKVNKFSSFFYCSKECKKLMNKSNLNSFIKRKVKTRLKKALRGNSKIGKTVELLGCTIPELRQYLESLFEPNMSWDNYGAWHIDHIRPCASFDLTDPEQQKLCFHYTNLQPLWAEDNLKKGKKLDWKK